MPDNLSILPAGAIGNAARPALQKPQPAIAPVQKMDATAAGSGSGARAEPQSLPAGAQHLPASNKPAAQRGETGEKPAQSNARKPDDKTLTGPPPAFQASLLEIEADLATTIRRVEAARERARNQQAVAAEEKAQHPPLDVEREAMKAVGLEGPPSTVELISARTGQS